MSTTMSGFKYIVLWSLLGSSCLPLFVVFADVFCQLNSPASIDLDHDESEAYPCTGDDPVGQTRLVWRTTDTTGDGFSDDEYYVKVYQNGVQRYSSGQKFSSGSGTSGLIGIAGLGGYQVKFECDLEWSLSDCENGDFDFRLVDCGCPQGDIPVVPCNVDSIESAANANCSQACDSGFYWDGDEGCVMCPNHEITATANVDYSGAVNLQQCGVLGTMGFWSLADQGTILDGGTGIEWEITFEDSVSNGVQRTNEFAQAFSQTQGQTTYFETSVTTGFTVEASATLFGTGTSVSASVDLGFTSGQEKSWETSQTASNSIGRAVTTTITSTQSISCSQTCGPDPNHPEKINAFIYNWVHAVIDKDTNQVLHYVRTCATVCKNDRDPPLCPPGFCAERECQYCLGGAYDNPVVDELASRVISRAPTMSPTNPPSNPCRSTVNDMLRKWTKKVTGN